MSKWLEVLELVEEWSQRNDKILRHEIKKLKLNSSKEKELFFSVKSRAYAIAGEKVRAETAFVTHGRFRDMGAGRTAKVESMATNRAILTENKKSKPRTPAPWYSRPFYGRLNALMGVVSAEIREQIVESVQLAADELGPRMAPKTRKK